MRVIIEARALASQKKKPYEENGVAKPTDVLTEVLVETTSLKMGVETSDTIKMNCVLPEFPVGSFRVEVKITTYIDRKTNQAKLSYKIIKLLK